MSEFTPDEIEGIVKAISQEPSEEEGGKIPVLPPGSYGPISKVAFTPISGEKPRPLSLLSEKERSSFEHLKAHVEVVFGKTKLTLKELAALEEGSLLPLDELCDDLVDIYVNHIKIGRGEVVTVDGRYGVKIISFVQNP
ncbi:MAG: FliM/FliN family flagellar motor switch protein [Chlamydiales bacterium]|nr:FliM/FliN family flagellar motor switch protein [Chlamydiales bacterium]